VIGLAMSRELGLDAEKARAGAMTMAFVTLAVDELWRVFCFRSQSRNFWQVNFFENKYLVLATVSSALIVVLSVVIEPLAKFLGNESLTLRQWGVALLLSLMPFAAVEAWTCTRRLVLRR
jgi:Ca2+-transporting ATPase